MRGFFMVQILQQQLYEEQISYSIISQISRDLVSMQKEKFEVSEGIITSYFARNDIKRIATQLGLHDINHPDQREQLRRIIILHEQTLGNCRWVSQKTIVNLPPQFDGRIIKAHSGLRYFHGNHYIAAIKDNNTQNYFGLSPANLLNPDLSIPYFPDGHVYNRLTHIFRGNTFEEMMAEVNSIEGGKWQIL